MQRECVICGKLFETKSSRRKFCYEEHYHPCPVCGAPVLTKDLVHLNECCCPEHSRQLATNTTHERFETWPTNSEEAKEKRKQTCLERYGVDNPSKNDDIKQRVSEGLLNRYKIDGSEIRERAKQTYFEKTGYYYASANPKIKEAKRQTMLTKYGALGIRSIPEFQKKIEKTCIERFGVPHPMQNHEIWAKQRSKKSQYRGCDGTLLDSTYEVAVYDFCIRNNIPIQRTHRIEYEYQGRKHTTFIDFVIDGLLVETKGEHALDGYFDSQPNAVPISRKLEIYEDNNVIVITGKDKAELFKGSLGQKYAEHSLIGVDISLFDNPNFPYRDDRPNCFFDVKVNNSLSCFEAFNDEQIRWQMIKNRIKYVGGFISANTIVTALNVTRKAKQPSWFSISYAEELLMKYSMSSVVIDPFAGWGTRCDASSKLGKYYIGIDLNQEVVKWHQEKGRNITLGDANEFKFEGNCDMFTCPPYRDTEIYFDNQDTTKSECDWLRTIMINIPNAKKYIMVCKEVAPEFEKYVVERKENRSHLNTNYESVLVLDQEARKKVLESLSSNNLQ